jgi:hypothetical protein
MIYQELNQSIDIETTSNKWAHYREQINHFIGPLKGHTLIIGAGNLLDLSLSPLESDHITLLDIDLDSMNKALIRQQYHQSVDLLEVDLMGLEKTDFYERLKYEDYLTSGYIFENTYDNIIMLPVYTQLILPKALSRAENVEELLSFVSNKIQLLNFEVVKALKTNGCLFCLSDVLEYQSQDEVIKYLEAHHANNFILDDFCLNHLKQYGMNTGFLGLFHLEDQLQLMKHNYYIWPFNEERTLLVKAIALKKA